MFFPLLFCAGCSGWLIIWAGLACWSAASSALTLASSLLAKSPKHAACIAHLLRLSPCIFHAGLRALEPGHGWVPCEQGDTRAPSFFSFRAARNPGTHAPHGSHMAPGWLWALPVAQLQDRMEFGQNAGERSSRQRVPGTSPALPSWPRRSGEATTHHRRGRCSGRAAQPVFVRA